MAKVTPRFVRLRTAAATVAGTSKNFRSTNTFLPRLTHPVEQLEVAAGHEQLQAELVEADRVAQLPGEATGGVRVGDVHGEDQALARGDDNPGHVGLLSGGRKSYWIGTFGWRG